MEFFHVQLDAFAQSTVRFLIPSAEPDWRLSPHPALPLWSISSHTLGAFLPISSASTVLLGGQLARSLRTFVPARSQRLGAFAISPHPGVHGFPVLRLLTNGVSLCQTK